jgi:small conductance mechanosensitive channel
MLSIPQALGPYIEAGITILGTWVVAFLLRGLIGGLMRRSNPQVRSAARWLAAILVWVVGLTLALQELGIFPDALLLIIGLLGVAALLALREPLENFSAKYFTDIYTPYKVGDTIQVRGVSGKVLEINAISTVLLSEENQLISVPNTAFLEEVVINTSPQAWKELSVPVRVDANVDLAEFESTLLKSLAKLKLRLDPRFPPMLSTKAHSPQGTDLTLTLMLRRPEERDAIVVEVNTRIAEALGQTPRVRR